MNDDARLLAQDSVSPFERIRHTHAGGAEYWSSRDFAREFANAPDTRGGLG